MKEKTDNHTSKSEEVKERVNALLGQLEDGISSLFESDKYKEYLKVMSKFHNYSFNNLMLIYMQKPDATNIAGYTSWDKSFHRHVKKGEKAIKIIAPEFFKREVETVKKDEAGSVIYDKEGKPVTEKKVQEYVTYKITNVFDISQTEGQDLPTLTHKLNADVADYKKIVEAIKKVSSVPITIKSYEGSSNGYYDIEKKEIVVQKSMSEAQIIKTMLHEVAHSILHDKEAGECKDADGQTKEVQAESIAYCVANYIGIDTSDYSFGYVAGWSNNKELDELKSSLNIINKTAAKLINDIDYSITKERLYDIEISKDNTYQKSKEKTYKHTLRH